MKTPILILAAFIFVVISVTAKDKLAERAPVDGKPSKKVSTGGKGPPPHSGRPLWVLKSKSDYDKIKGIIVRKSSKGWHLEKGKGLNTQLATNKEFAPPFRILIRIKPTTEASVRVFHMQRFLAELNQGPAGKDLILHNPAKDRHVLWGKGELKVNRMNDLEFLVTKTKLMLWVDGKKRGEIAGDFSQNKGIVSISPFRDCPVLVEKFEIWP